MNFKDIELYPHARWEVDVELRDLADHVDRWTHKYGLTLEPDFQRAHVWTEAQQIAFVEHILRGGEVGKTIIINAPGWNAGTSKVAEVVDGKQRLTALIRFINNEIKVFGHLYQEFTGRPRCFISIKWRVVELDREGVLKLYLSLNGGGTPHTAEELAKVRSLLRTHEV